MKLNKGDDVVAVRNIVGDSLISSIVIPKGTGGVVIFVDKDRYKVVFDGITVWCDDDDIKPVVNVNTISGGAAVDCLLKNGWLKKHDKEMEMSGYNRGYDDGYDDGKREGYKEGIKEAWSTAKMYSLLTWEEADEVLAGHNTDEPWDLPVEDAMRRMEEWKEKCKKEIQVGDEVCRKDREECKLVVIALNDNNTANGINFQGSCYIMDICDYKKTGRHFPEIAEVLKKMRGEED